MIRTSGHCGLHLRDASDAFFPAQIEQEQRGPVLLQDGREAFALRHVLDAGHARGDRRALA